MSSIFSVDFSRLALRIEALLERFWLLLVAGLTLWGLSLRLDGWGDWALNPDEGIFFVAGVAPVSVAREIALHNANPPAYYALLRFMVACGGGAEAMRALSLIAGTALVPTLFLLGRQMGGAAAALIAATLIARSPGAIMLSQVIRPYALHVLLLATAMLALWHFVLHRRQAAIWLYAVLISTACYIHYSAFIIVAGNALFLVWLAFGKGFDRTVRVALVVAHVAIGTVIAVLFFTHVAGLMESGMRNDAVHGWLREQFLGSPTGIPDAIRRALWYVAGYRVEIGITLLLATGWLLDRERLAPFVNTAAVLSAAVALSLLELYPLGRTRHAYYLAVLLLPTAGVATAALLRSKRPAFAICGIGFVVLALASLAAGVFGTGAGEPRRLLTERTLTRSDASAFRSAFLRETRRDDLVLTDQESFFTWWPLVSERAADRAPEMEIEGASLFHIAGRRVLVGSAWHLETTPSAERGRSSLLSLLKVAEPLIGTRKESQRHSVWLALGGGWDRYAPLPLIGPTGDRVSGSERATPRLSLYRLHPDGYRASADFNGTPGGIRTSDLLFRKLLETELRGPQRALGDRNLANRGKARVYKSFGKLREKRQQLDGAHYLRIPPSAHEPEGHGLRLPRHRCGESECLVLSSARAVHLRF
ncbi:MAG: glycosyltransferase family 39 protein [Myxococcota bacterium]|nr:glycosyltransferase family 39 protein [Myxococcota bacterium]